MAEEEWLVLRTNEGRYFLEWLRLPSGPVFRWTYALACARRFPLRDRLLCESFRIFIRNNQGPETEAVPVENGRLIRVHEQKPFEPKTKQQKSTVSWVEKPKREW